MAFSVTNDYITGRKPPVTCDCNEATAVRYNLNLATGDVALNTVGAIGILPAGHVPVGILIDSDALAASALVWSIGLSNTGPATATPSTPSISGTDISTAAADGGAAWATSITVSVGGGQVQPLSKALSRVLASQYDRAILLKATTGAVTPAAGEIGVTLIYRAAVNGSNLT